MKALLKLILVLIVVLLIGLVIYAVALSDDIGRSEGVKLICAEAAL